MKRAAAEDEGGREEEREAKRRREDRRAAEKVHHDENDEGEETEEDERVPLHEAMVKTEVLGDDEDAEGAEAAVLEELEDDDGLGEMAGDELGLADMDADSPEYSTGLLILSHTIERINLTSLLSGEGQTAEPMAVEGVARVPLAGFAPPANSVVAAPAVVGAGGGACTAQDSLVGEKLALERVRDVERVVLAAGARAADAAAATRLLQMPRAELLERLRARQETMHAEASKIIEECKEDDDGCGDEKERNGNGGDDESGDDDYEEDEGAGQRRPEWFDVERVLRGNANLILNLYLLQIQRLSTTKFTAEDELAAQLAVNLATLLPLATLRPSATTAGSAESGATTSGANGNGNATTTHDAPHNRDGTQD